MSLELSGEITAVATAVLAIFAIVTAFYARRAFLKQSHEVGILAAQNERDISVRRREQASRVFIWTEPTSGPDPQTIGAAGIISHIRNTSQQPIYDGFIGCRDGTGRTADNLDIPAFPVLMPGEQQDITNIFAAPVTDVLFWEDNSPFLAGLRFRDAAGVQWRIRSDGRLNENSRPAHGRR